MDLKNKMTHRPTDWLAKFLSDWSWLVYWPTADLVTCISWLTYWLTGWLTDWLADLFTCTYSLTNWLIGWLTDWLSDLLADLQTYVLKILLTNWLADLLSYSLTDWLIDWLTCSRVLTHWPTDLSADWLIDCLTCWLTYRHMSLKSYWPIDWLTYSVTHWLTDCMTDIDWLTDSHRLNDWLVHCLTYWLDWLVDTLEKWKIMICYINKINFRFRSPSFPNQKWRNYRWLEKHFGCYQQEQICAEKILFLTDHNVS